MLDAGRAVGQPAADVVQGLLRAPLRLGDAFAQPVGNAGDLAAQLLQRQGVAVVGRNQPLLNALGEPAHVGLDLAAQLLEADRGFGLDRLDPAVEVLGDAQDLAAHGLDGLGGAFLGRLDLIADSQHRAFDAVHPAFGLSGVEPPHHLGAVALDLTAQRLGKLLEAGRLADALGLGPGLGGAQALVQAGERGLQIAQGLGGAALRLIQPLADLGQQVRPHAGTGDLLDRVHPVAQLVDARTLALLDVIEAAGQGAHGRLDLAEGLGRLGADLLFKAAQAFVPFAQLLGDIVNAACIGLTGIVLPFKPTHQAGDGLVDPLDSDGRAALRGFQPAGDGVDRGPEALKLVIADAIGVVDAAAAPAAVDAVGGMGPT